MRKLMYLAIALCATASTSAQAHCTRSEVSLVTFMVKNAPTNFSAIRSAAGLTPAAEAFCPNFYILRDNAATSTSSEYWFVKFDFEGHGTVDDLILAVIKRITPMLKRYGFKDKPALREGGSHDASLTWQGPSNTWVNVSFDGPDTDVGDAPNKVLYEYRVGHDVR